MGRVSIVDAETVQYLDVFQVVLLDMARMTPLPELYEIFGKESLVKFLDIFAGVTFTVPPRDVLVNTVRDVDIYVTLQRTGTDSKDTVEDLSRKHGLTSSGVKDAYTRVDKMIRKLYEVSTSKER